MTSRSVHRAGRVALLIAAACLAVVLGIAIARLMAAAPSDAAKQHLAVAQAIAGALSAIAAVSGALLARSQAPSRGKRLSDMLTPQLLDEERLINRTTELRDLVARIDDSRAVGCHGPRGAGKSFLLEHLTDVINGHRPLSPGQPRPSRVAAALYFDLADAVGFAEAQAQICGAALGDRTGTWEDFAFSVQSEFKRRRVVLILDNVNSEGMWRQLGQAAHRYCAVRRTDRILFGSIDQVVLSNLDVAQVPVLGLDLDATEELVATRGVTLSHEDLVALHSDWRGLPFYVRLFTAQDGRLAPAALSDQRIIPEISEETRRLLAHMSLVALVARRISVGDLRGCAVANLEEQLGELAVRRALVSPIPEGRERRFKIHDIVRDTALRELGSDVENAALALFQRAYGHGDLEHAALFAMFADPDQIETAQLDDLLEQVIRTAIKAKNYTLIGTLYTRASENAGVLQFIAEDESRADLFCFARASQLAGLGRCEEAEEEMLASSVVRRRWRRDTEGSDLQGNLRFMQADLAHLLNRYDESARMFEELGEWAATTDRTGLQALCVWGHGHVLRHQGRDLESALALLDRASILAEAAGELFAKAYAGLQRQRDQGSHRRRSRRRGAAPRGDRVGGSRRLDPAWIPARGVEDTGAALLVARRSPAGQRHRRGGDRASAGAQRSSPLQPLLRASRVPAPHGRARCRAGGLPHRAGVRLRQPRPQSHLQRPAGARSGGAHRWYVASPRHERRRARRAARRA